MFHSRGRTLSRRSRRRFRAVATLVVLALVLAACGGGRDDDDATGGNGNGNGNGEEETLIDTTQCTSDTSTGIDGNVIKLGTSLPQSGLYSAFAEILRGESAYFEYVNEELGGVEIAGETYQIELVNRDDEYQAEQTVSSVNQLINDENVFALFNVVGTKNNLAIRETVQAECIPNLFAATGSPAWGNQDYPWMLGTALVPYPLEMKALVDYLQENDPDATVAILRANDDFGAAYSQTFSSLIEGTDITVAAEETYNVEVFDTKSQITSLAASRADVLILGATLLACPDALNNVAAANWDPLVYMSGTCTSKTLMTIAGENGDGVLTVLPTLDPANPANDSNEAMALYKEKVGQYQPDADPENGIVAYGWTTAAMLVALLEQSPAADRVAVMETARNFEVSDVGIGRPGATFSTSADDWFLGETFSLVQYSHADGFFADVGELIEEDGNTAEYSPENLING